MNQSLYIIGAGGFGREVFGIIEAIAIAGGPRYKVRFIDDSPSGDNLGRVTALGSQVAGTVEDLVRLREEFGAVVAIGSSAARRSIAMRLASTRVSYPVLVHPDATVGINVELGDGCVVAPGARLSTGIRIGSHVHVDQNATIGHDSSILEFARLNPQVCVSGAVRIGCGALLGAGSIVLQGLVIGDGAIVGAGAVVTKDVRSGVTVKGVPAR